MLGGSGLSWQDEQVYELRPGDCVVHLADHEEHTLRGGPDGLDVLIYGTRHPTEIGWLPRSGRSASAGRGSRGGRTTRGTSRLQAEPLEFGEPAPRPPNIVNVDDASVDRGEGVRLRMVELRYLSRAAGSVQTGMRHRGRPGRQAQLPAALPRLRGGVLPRPRRRRDVPTGRRRAPDPARARSSAARRARASRTPSAGRSRCSRTARGSRTTSATTRARTRSASGASASSPASRASTTGTASRPA